jgi:hypothetical protein
MHSDVGDGLKYTTVPRFAEYPATAGQASQAAKKGSHSFCHSERSEESLFLFMGLNRREIPRFARNDKINYFFRSLFSLSAFEFGPNQQSTG